MTGTPNVPPLGAGRSTSLGAHDPRPRRGDAAQVQRAAARENALARLRGVQLPSTATTAEIIEHINALTRAVTEGT